MEEKSSDYTIFGQDIFAIPCFRDSFLYGLSAATGTSLFTFLFTSSGIRSSNFAFGALMFTAFPYMIYCQEKHYATVQSLKEVQDRVKDITNEDFRISDTLIADDLTPESFV